MTAGYTRQSVASIVNGNVINASDFNNEYNALLAAFDRATGHVHDGTTVGGGAPIPNVGLVNSSLTIGSTNVALGATVATFAGVTLTSPTATGTVTLTGATVTGGTYGSAILTTPTINGATVTGTVSGGTYTSTTLTAPTINAATVTGTISGGTFTSSSLTSPTLTGTPVAPTPITSTDTTQIATTAYVKANIANYLPLVGGVLSGPLYISGGTVLAGAGQFALSASATTGALITGNGSVNDVLVVNAAGLSVFSVTHNQQIVNFAATPTVPTSSTSDNSVSAASTAYVQNQFATSRVLANPASQTLGSSGLIIKTGTGVTSGGGGGGTSGADIVTFAAAFPNGVISLQLTQKRNAVIAHMFYESLSTSTFQVRATSVSGGTDTISQYSWTAIGY